VLSGGNIDPALFGEILGGPPGPAPRPGAAVPARPGPVPG
jgi:hypothetical protein